MDTWHLWAVICYDGRLVHPVIVHSGKYDGSQKKIRLFRDKKIGWSLMM